MTAYATVEITLTVKVDLEAYAIAYGTLDNIPRHVGETAAASAHAAFEAGAAEGSTLVEAYSNGKRVLLP